MTATRKHLAGLELALERWNDGGHAIQYGKLLSELIEQAQSAPEPVQGEAVEVVAHVATMGFGQHYASGIGEPIDRCIPGEPLMTVAQHRRIMAAATRPADQVAEGVVVSRALEGWKLVPVDPTPEMAAQTAYDGMQYSNPFDFDDFRKDYAAMLAAAPAHPAAQQVGQEPQRCQCCGYLVTESEHRGCLRAAAPQPAPAQPAVHPDDAAVDRFAAAMKAKLAKAREKGRGGWDDPAQCSVEFLAKLLVEHLTKGNAGTFEDVANFAMMLHQRGADPQVLADAAAFTQQPSEGYEVVAEVMTGCIGKLNWLVMPNFKNGTKLYVEAASYEQ